MTPYLYKISATLGISFALSLLINTIFNYTQFNFAVKLFFIIAFIFLYFPLKFFFADKKKFSKEWPLILSITVITFPFVYFQTNQVGLIISLSLSLLSALLIFLIFNLILNEN